MRGEPMESPWMALGTAGSVRSGRSLPGEGHPEAPETLCPGQPRVAGLPHRDRRTACPGSHGGAGRGRHTGERASLAWDGLSGDVTESAPCKRLR